MKHSLFRFAAIYVLVCWPVAAVVASDERGAVTEALVIADIKVSSDMADYRMLIDCIAAENPVLAEQLRGKSEIMLFDVIDIVQHAGLSSYTRQKIQQLARIILAKNVAYQRTVIVQDIDDMVMSSIAGSTLARQA